MYKVHLKTHNGHYVCAEDGGGRELVANRQRADIWETFILFNVKGGPLQSGSTVFIKAYNKQYLCAEDGGGREVVVNRNSPAQWESFIIEKMNGTGKINNGDKISLKTYNGKYVCAEDGGGQTIVANRDKADIWETFTLEIEPPLPVRLRAYNGRYVCAEGGGGQALVANRNVGDIWETFQLTYEKFGQLQSGDTIYLQVYNKQYICAENGGGQEVIANRDKPAQWESFIIEKVNGTGQIQNGDKIVLKTYNGKYWCAEGGGGREVVANRDKVDVWETFTIEFYEVKPTNGIKRKVIHLSDLHIGLNNSTVPTQQFQKVINSIINTYKKETLKPIVVVTGDIVDYGYSQLPQLPMNHIDTARSMFDQLAKEGFKVLAVPGNHDYSDSFSTDCFTPLQPLVPEISIIARVVAAYKGNGQSHHLISGMTLNYDAVNSFKTKMAPYLSNGLYYESWKDKGAKYDLDFILVDGQDMAMKRPWWDDPGKLVYAATYAVVKATTTPLPGLNDVVAKKIAAAVEKYAYNANTIYQLTYEATKNILADVVSNALLPGLGWLPGISDLAEHTPGIETIAKSVANAAKNAIVAPLADRFFLHNGDFRLAHGYLDTNKLSTIKNTVNNNVNKQTLSIVCTHYWLNYKYREFIPARQMLAIKTLEAVKNPNNIDYNYIFLLFTCVSRLKLIPLNDLVKFVAQLNRVYPPAIFATIRSIVQGFYGQEGSVYSERKYMADNCVDGDNTLVNEQDLNDTLDKCHMLLVGHRHHNKDKEHQYFTNVLSDVTQRTFSEAQSAQKQYTKEKLFSMLNNLSLFKANYGDAESIKLQLLNAIANTVVTSSLDYKNDTRYQQLEKETLKYIGFAGAPAAEPKEWGNQQILNDHLCWSELTIDLNTGETTQKTLR